MVILVNYIFKEFAPSIRDFMFTDVKFTMPFCSVPCLGGCCGVSLFPLTFTAFLFSLLMIGLPSGLPTLLVFSWSQSLVLSIFSAASLWLLS